MKLQIRRGIPTGRSTPSEMLVDGVYKFHTLEPDPTTPVHVGHPSILQEYTMCD